MPGNTLQRRIVLGGSGAAFPDPLAIFGSNIKLWVEATSITGVADGAKIGSSWVDLSGNSNHLLQATTGKQFSYIANDGSGKPVIRSTAKTTYHQASFVLAQPFIVIIAFKATDVGAAGDKDFIMDGWAADSADIFMDTLPRTGLFAGSAVTSTPSIVNNNVFGVMSVLFSGSSSYIRNNGTTILSSINPGTASPNGITLGTYLPSATRGIGMDIFGCCAVSGASTTTLINQCEKYFGNKIGVSVT